MNIMQNMGMNIQDVTELWQGSDLVAYDPDLNWLIFDVTNYSTYNIASMLEKYDVPIPQVRLKISVYEVYRENDEKIGIDFQSWKNNEGADFFSAGGRYRNNWAAMYQISPQFARSYGSERTSYYNFNPKWNTRYLDFLAAKNLITDARCYNSAAFHCQQCIEKALKGYLLFKKYKLYV